MAKDQRKGRVLITAALAGGLGLGLFVFSGARDVLGQGTEGVSQKSGVQMQDTTLDSKKKTVEKKKVRPPKKKTPPNDQGKVDKKDKPKCGLFIVH
jgi:hypothetical protein